MHFWLAQHYLQKQKSNRCIKGYQPTSQKIIYKSRNLIGVLKIETIIEITYTIYKSRNLIGVLKPTMKPVDLVRSTKVEI